MSRQPAPENPVLLDAEQEAIDVLDAKSSTGSPSEEKTRPVFISTVNKDEPVVTRRELWSYYCEQARYRSYIS